MDNATLIGSGPGFGLASIKMAAALLLLLGLVFLGLALLRKTGLLSRVQVKSQTSLCIEDRLVLGPRKQLVVVRFLNKQLVLGITDSGITLITEADHGPHLQTSFSSTLEHETREMADPTD